LFLLRAYSLRADIELPHWTDIKTIKAAMEEFILEDIAGFTAK
jgi:hypothetical protein